MTSLSSHNRQTFSQKTPIKFNTCLLVQDKLIELQKIALNGTSKTISHVLQSISFTLKLPN